MDRFVGYLNGQKFLDTHINKDLLDLYMDRLVGYIHGQKFLDTHIKKTYWIFTWQTFWIHTRTRLVGYTH